jgi:hypothetical protein
MSELIITGPDGGQIKDWRAWTRPKKDYQWRAGRSAMELARAWFTSPTPTCPREICDLLASLPRGTGLRLVTGLPEHVTPLPERGEGRNHDLLLYGHTDDGDIVISVESKVDESFGETVGAYWSKGRRSKTPTRAPERIETLLLMAFGAEARPDTSPWKELRYQLLTGVIGTAIEASRRGVATAVVVVHEFRTESADVESLATNSEDFRAFVSALLRLPKVEVAEGRMYGPAVLRSGAHLAQSIDVFIGKAVFDWRQRPEC